VPSGTALTGDQTATALCLALPWTGSWQESVSRRALLTAGWPLRPVLQEVRYSTVVILRLLSEN